MKHLRLALVASVGLPIIIGRRQGDNDPTLFLGLAVTIAELLLGFLQDASDTDT